MRSLVLFLCLHSSLIVGCASRSGYNVEKNIESEFKFSSKFLTVGDYKVHYIDEGKGDPILLLHGNPTNVYLWRNIVPNLSLRHRVLAIDLIGLGKSDKEYKKNLFYVNQEMLRKFIEKMKLKKLVIVGHDWGGALAYDYASRNDLKGLVLIEPVRPKKRLDSFFGRVLWKTSFLEWYMVSKNYFVETMIPSLTARSLTDQELDNYRRPVKSEEDRLTTYKWWTLLPFESEKAELFPVLNKSLSTVAKSGLSKLFIVANPGVIITKKIESRFKETFKNTIFINIGDGKHFLQESHPKKISRAIIGWNEKHNN